ncbi:hypothetical protein DFH28DRAFT_923757 [Melampsora americana]|nr:hypothetical protein DFH28DRAFT_923757 [Melampsora americana]
MGRSLSEVEAVADGRNVLVNGASNSEKLADGITERTSTAENYVHVRKVDGTHESDGIAAPESGQRTSLPAPQAPLSVEKHVKKEATQEGKGSRIKAVQDYVSKVWDSFKKHILQAWRYLSDRVQSLKLRKNKDATRAEASSKAASASVPEKLSASSKDKIAEPAKKEMGNDQLTPSTPEETEHVEPAQGVTKEPLTMSSPERQHSDVEVKDEDGSQSLPDDSQTSEVHQDSKKDTNPLISNVEDHPKAPLSDHKEDVTPVKEGTKGVSEDMAHSNAPVVEFSIVPESNVDPQVPHNH